jgi:thiamine biosynthesis lipoprotein
VSDDGEWFWRAMGSDCHVVVVGAPVGPAVSTVERLERRWSRFLPDSDVSRANAAAGSAVTVSSDTVLLAHRVRQATTLTDGWFDALLGAEVVAAGYDRDVAEVLAARGRVAPGAARSAPARPTGARPPSAAPLRVGDDWVAVPHGRALDVGGIGKGLAADLAVEACVEAGATGVLVNLGGDVRVWGRTAEGRPLGVVVAADSVTGAPTGRGWDDGADDLLVGLDDGAVATSTTRRRRWWDASSGVAHHLVDPVTRRPTSHDLHTVTVVTGAGWWADAAASALVAAGPAAPALAIDLDLVARLTYDDGVVLHLGAWDAVAVPAA